MSTPPTGGAAIANLETTAPKRRSSDSRSGHRTLAVLSLAQFLIALDYSIIYIALPSIAADLNIEASLAQWVISAYAVMFAGFLVVGGRLSDLMGAKRLFIVAALGFGVASAVGGAASGGSFLLVARGAQGLSAALLQPAVLGLIGTTFPAGVSRSRALAVWGSVGASGLAAGAILGGLLTTASWRLTFYINIPLTLAACVGAVLWIRSGRTSERRDRIPLIASALGTCAVLTIVLGLTFGSDRGWSSPLTIGCLGIALALLASFLVNERTSDNVLIERVLRRTGSLRAGGVATALYMASVGSEFYVLTMLLQTLKDYSPLQAGLAFLPLAVLVTAGNAAAGRMARSVSPALVLLLGFALAAVGLFWLSLTAPGQSYLIDLLPGVALSGFGHGVIYTSMFVIGTRDVAPSHQGSAGALLTASQYLSGAITVAILTLVLGSTPGQYEFRIALMVTGAAALMGVMQAAVIEWRTEAREVSPASACSA
ncbi:MAG: MFS transporter [Nocardioidaceae bacterium]